MSLFSHTTIKNSFIMIKTASKEFQWASVAITTLVCTRYTKCNFHSSISHCKSIMSYHKILPGTVKPYHSKIT